MQLQLPYRAVNQNHSSLCSSPEWAAHLQADVLPYLAAHAPLGDSMLELGPGPGAATDWLRQRVRRLVALESDAGAMLSLKARYPDSNVTVVLGDAAELTFPDDSFDSVGSFTMLHHVPTVGLQLRILAEVRRVLVPGGALLGSDSLASDDLHRFHAGDTYNPIEPASLLVRLQTLGFERVTLVVDETLKFIAYKPAGKAPVLPPPDMVRIDPRHIKESDLDE
jgi:ubiquinone/menaquinone biosynthesis C-methylase UbiE